MEIPILRAFIWLSFLFLFESATNLVLFPLLSLSRTCLFFPLCTTKSGPSPFYRIPKSTDLLSSSFNFEGSPPGVTGPFSRARQPFVTCWPPQFSELSRPFTPDFPLRRIEFRFLSPFIVSSTSIPQFSCSAAAR